MVDYTPEKKLRHRFPVINARVRLALVRKNKMMNFKLIDSIEVTAHIQDVANKTTNQELKQNILNLLSKLRNGDLFAYHGFENDYGEKYLMLGVDYKEWWWAGSESDWVESSSRCEDKFVNQTLEIELNTIIDG